MQHSISPGGEAGREAGRAWRKELVISGPGAGPEPAVVDSVLLTAVRPRPDPADLSQLSELLATTNQVKSQSSTQPGQQKQPF